MNIQTKYSSGDKVWFVDNGAYIQDEVAIVKVAVSLLQKGIGYVLLKHFSLGTKKEYELFPSMTDLHISILEEQLARLATKRMEWNYKAEQERRKRQNDYRQGCRPWRPSPYDWRINELRKEIIRLKSKSAVMDEITNVNIFAGFMEKMAAVDMRPKNVYPIMREPKVLHLVLKGKWYDMIESGVKTEEYREHKDYWVSRLTDGLCEDYPSQAMVYVFKPYTSVCFHRGYTSMKMEFLIKEFKYGYGNAQWGAPADKPVFIIKLGERL